MRFYEHESKALFARHGLPMGPNGLAHSADEARQLAAELSGPVVLKSQVLSGGRMKAGAVKFADTPDEAGPHFDTIMGIEVSGQKPTSVLAGSTAPAGHAIITRWGYARMAKMGPKNNVGINHPKMVASRWKPVQSGNPEGRPKRESFESVVSRILDEMVPGHNISNREAIARRFVELLTDGDIRIFREFLAREWPATTRVEAVVPAEVVFVAPEQYLDAEEWEKHVKRIGQK